MKEIESIRNSVNKIDKEIIALIEKRLDLASEILIKKLALNLSGFSPDRETEVMSILQNMSSDKLSTDDLRRIFAEIISVCRKVESDEKMIVFGEKYGLCHNCVRSQYGKTIPLSFRYKWKQIVSDVRENHKSFVSVLFQPGNNDFTSIFDDLLAERFRIVAESHQITKFSLVSKSCENLFDLSEILIPREFRHSLIEWIGSLNISAKITICNFEEEAYENLLESKSIAAILPQDIALDAPLNFLKKDIIPADTFPLRLLTLSASRRDHHGKSDISSSQGTFLIANNSDTNNLPSILQTIEKSDFAVTAVTSFQISNKPFKNVFWIDVTKNENLSSVEDKILSIKKANQFSSFLGFYKSVKCF